jgi:hypothetical protein
MRTILPSSVSGSSAGVLEDAVAHLPREVEPAPVPLEPLDNPQRVLVVAEAAAAALPQHGVERLLAGVPERRMPEVVAEPDRLDEILVQLQRAGDAAGDARRLERVRERVRKWSPSGSTKTCVFSRRRRNAFEWTMRSRSRWNGVRRRHSSPAVAPAALVGADGERRQPAFLVLPHEPLEGVSSSTGELRHLRQGSCWVRQRTALRR